jgi:hypothetical protein
MRRTGVSAPEPAARSRETAGVRLASCPADIVEIASLRQGAGALLDAAILRSWRLPPCGRITASADGLCLCVRPQRWLLICPPAPPGTLAQYWEGAARGCGAAVDLSSALSGLYVSGVSAL